MPITTEVKDARRGDIGVRLEVQFVDSVGAAINLSGASAKRIHIQKPDGTVLTKDASFTTDGTDGKIYYTTASGDLSTEGDYYMQGYAVYGTNTKTTAAAKFTIGPTLV